MPTEYPRRGRHFAHKLTRLLTKSCAALEIGPEACWLITVIAHQEDVRRYSSAVTFYNEQLMAICGFGSQSRLIRFRERAVAAGWLHYEAGGKSIPGRYWTLAPEKFKGLPDTPTDEGQPISTPKTESQNPTTSDNLRSQNGSATANEGTKNHYQTGSTTGAQPERNRSATANLPFLDPDPIPNPEDKNPLKSPKGDDAQGEQEPTRKRARKKHTREYSADFERFWTAYPPIRREKKAKAWDAWLSAIQRKPPEEIIAAAAEFSRSELGRDEYCPGPAPWLNQDRWDDDRRAWKRPSKGNGVSIGAGQTYQQDQAGVRKTF